MVNEVCNFAFLLSEVCNFALNTSQFKILRDYKAKLQTSPGNKLEMLDLYGEVTNFAWQHG
jgi:hypothetical protein